MNATIKRFSGLALAMAIVSPVGAAVNIDFESLPLSGPGTYYNGSDHAGQFASQGVTFNNQYTDWGAGAYSWGGFSYSNVADTTTAGFTNQFASFPGSGAGASSQYALAYYDSYTPTIPTITLPIATTVHGISVANTTYAALAMQDGDWGTKKYGGSSGTDPDWFKLIVTAYDATGQSLGTVEHYLADYRFAESSQDYIQSNWQTLDLSLFGHQVKSLAFSFDTTDVGPWGFNTPLYVAIDDLSLAQVPEPTSLALLALAVASAAIKRSGH